MPSYLILNKEKEKIWRQNLNVPSIELINQDPFQYVKEAYYRLN